MTLGLMTRFKSDGSPADERCMKVDKTLVFVRPLLPGRMFGRAFVGAYLGEDNDTIHILVYGQVPPGGRMVYLHRPARETQAGPRGRLP